MSRWSRVVQAAQPDAGDRETDAEHHQHPCARRARRRRAARTRSSLINTVTSITGVDLDLMAPEPVVDGQGTHGGYCGPAVKPIALHMVGDIARDMPGCPVSGIGGIASWRDAAEFIALGAGNVQVCTAAMHHGFRIVDDMIDGLSNWMDAKGYRTLADFRGARGAELRALGRPEPELQDRWRASTRICASSAACATSPARTPRIRRSRRSASMGERRYEVIDAECVGCNLCAHVCPVDGCISMVPQPSSLPKLVWGQHPNNPMRVAAAAE